MESEELLGGGKCRWKSRKSREKEKPAGQFGKRFGVLCRFDKGGCRRNYGRRNIFNTNFYRSPA